MVATGYSYTDKSQVIDVSSSSTACANLPSYPFAMYLAAGGFVNGVPIICGGNPLTDKCHIHDNNNNEWRHFASLSGKRASSASVSLDNYLWVTGNEKLHLIFLLFVHCV